MNCDLCKEHPGLMRVRAKNSDGSTYTTLVLCRCRVEAKRQAERDHPGGFEPVGEILGKVVGDRGQGTVGKPLQPVTYNLSPAVSAVLTPHDKKIAALIQARVGKPNAIRGRDLAVAIWPSEMADPAKYESAVRRWLEDSISRLRRFARLPIAASKSNPMGYYIPATAQECDEVHDRLFGEGIERIKDSQLFRFDRDLVERLRGQLELQDSGFRSQKSEASHSRESGNPEARTQESGGGNPSSPLSTDHSPLPVKPEAR